MNSELHSIIARLCNERANYAKITREIYDEGDALEIISIEGKNIVAVVLLWSSHDISFDLLSKKQEGSLMDQTKHFSKDRQNRDTLGGFIDDFVRLDDA